MDDLTIRVMQLAGQGYCCSQILSRLALEAQGRQNPDLVRALTGLCLGIGNSGGTCGVFSGAACLLALYAGKGSDEERADEKLPLMFAELTDWFAGTVGGTYGGVTCTDILGEGERQPQPGRCGAILVNTYHQVLQILTENGFDPASGRNEEDW
jgi:Putative redox-active protein (C_GCAxxG_C_C)